MPKAFKAITLGVRNLTYPYYPRLLDRADYVAGAVVLMFVVDRVGRVIVCKALPAFIGYGALLLYLLHPWMMAALSRGEGQNRQSMAGSLRYVARAWKTPAPSGSSRWPYRFSWAWP